MVIFFGGYQKNFWNLIFFNGDNSGMVSVYSSACVYLFAGKIFNYLKKSNLFKRKRLGAESSVWENVKLIAFEKVKSQIFHETSKISKTQTNHALNNIIM